MSASRKPPIKAIAATQSTLDPRRWLLQFACGHEAFVTSRRTPSLRARCQVCSRSPSPVHPINSSFQQE